LGKSEEDAEIVVEHFDKFCSSVEWSLLFPDAIVIYLDEHISDVLRILLKFWKDQRGKARWENNFSLKTCGSMIGGVDKLSTRLG